MRTNSSVEKSANERFRYIIVSAELLTGFCTQLIGVFACNFLHKYNLQHVRGLQEAKSDCMSCGWSTLTFGLSFLGHD